MHYDIPWDFSAAYLNPAGLGLYRSSEFSISPQLDYLGTKATYFNQNNEDYKYQFSMGNLGYVGTFMSGSDNGLVSASYAVGYSRLSNFGSNIYVGGINENNSLSDYFLYYADGQIPENLDPFYERLAFDAYVIDTIPGTGNQYQTPVLLPIAQRKTIETKGGTGEWTFALGLNFSNVFYTGLDIGFRQLRYDQTSVHSEFDDYNLNDFNNFSFTEDLNVKGTGVSIKMGLMARVLKVVRIGGAIHLPTFYKISENYYNTIRSEFDDGSVYNVKPTDTDNNLLDAGTFDYKLNSPLRLLGGVSVQIGTSGIIAADIEYLDYSSMRLRESDNYTDFTDSNREIESVYKSVLNLKAGGEFRLGNFSLRAGGGYYPSPYDAGELNQNASYGEITAGFGYRDSNIFFDLGLSGIMHSEKYVPYQFDNVVNVANLDQTRIRLLASFGIRL